MRTLRSWGAAAVVLALAVVLSQRATLPPPAPSPPPRALHRAAPQPHPNRKPLHLVISRQAGRLKVFDGQGRLIFVCAVRNETVGLGFLHFGACPDGVYGVGAPVPCGTPAFGPYFIPLSDLTPGGPFHRYHRHGVGIHGGGSGLPNPYARWQGWCRTRGCWRVQNLPLLQLVRLIRTARKEKQRLLLSIVG